MTPQELTKAIIALGLTQTEIRDRTGISQPTISRILNGKNTDLRVSVLRALEDLYRSVIEA